MAKVLSINAGSSSLKWELFEMPSERPLAEGANDILLSNLQTLGLVQNLDEITAIGHRVVAGGGLFFRPNCH